MDKQTFYSELSERLIKLDVAQDYISRHLKQFDGYFSDKNDEEISAEIEKLGDLDRVAARIKRMTDKLAENEVSAENDNKTEADEEPSRPKETLQDLTENEVSEDLLQKEASKQVLSDEDMIVFAPSARAELEDDPDSDESPVVIHDGESEPHGTKRGMGLSLKKQPDDTIVTVSLDEATIQNNRRKFWILFAATLPITLSVLAATATLFVMTFFAIAMVIIFAIGALVAITALGTLVSVFGIILGVAQMLSSLPIGLYECGIAIVVGSLAMFSGILVYNFAVRLMPFVAKRLLVFAKYVARKYKELFVYLKKECVGL